MGVNAPGHGLELGPPVSVVDGGEPSERVAERVAAALS